MNKEELMNMNIDEDMLYAVETLNDNGIKTLSCCDGVLEHHKNIDYLLGDANIAFEYSDAADKFVAYMYENGFNYSISSKYDMNGYDLFGQFTHGNFYTINFKNYYGELTNKFNKLIENYFDNNITISQIFINEIIKNRSVIESNEECMLSFHLNTSMRFKMDESFPCLTIRNKAHNATIIDAVQVEKILNENYTIQKYSDELDYKSLDIFYRIDKFNNTNIYFNISKLDTILEIIQLLKNHF